MYMQFYSREEAVVWGTKHFGQILVDYQKNGCFDSLIPYHDFSYKQYVLEQRGGNAVELGRADYNHHYAISMYAGHCFQPINNWLRENNSTPINLTNAEIIILLCQFLEDKVIPEDIIVYRILPEHCIRSLFGGSISKTVKGIENGFMSTSLINNSSKKNKSWVLEIKIPAGTAGCYIELISRRPSEQEVLFPPGASLIIDTPHPFIKLTRKVSCTLSYEIDNANLYQRIATEIEYNSTVERKEEWLSVAEMKKELDALAHKKCRGL